MILVIPWLRNKKSSSLFNLQMKDKERVHIHSVASEFLPSATGETSDKPEIKSSGLKNPMVPSMIVDTVLSRVFKIANFLKEAEL